MPQWRKLHTKTVDSIDLTEMPDDFTRLTWVMLPLILDRCGRGIDNASWVRSKVHPMRDDVKVEQVQAALDWYGSRGMIERYEVGGRHYFHIPTWQTYQGNTEREAESVIPGPDGGNDYGKESQEDDESESGASQEQVESESGPDVDVEIDSDVEKEVDTEKAIGGKPPDPPPKPSETVDFDTPEARKLKARLQATAKAKGRRGPLHFETLEQKRRFLKAVKALGSEFDAMLTKAMEAGCTSRARTIDYIVGCSKNKGKPPPRYGRRADTRAPVVTLAEMPDVPDDGEPILPPPDAVGAGAS